MEEDVSTLFEPEPQSAALILLRKLVGCTFDYIWQPGGGSGGGSCSGTGDVFDIIASLIEVFNWGMLAVIAAVATYLIYAALKDTANDGQAGGRSMNPSWTLVMAAIGAILCFPAFNGFSALQLGTMQVAVWSTGFGDNMWRTAAGKMINANAVDRTFSNVFKSDDPAAAGLQNKVDLELRKEIVNALYARVSSELCRRELQAGSDRMATTASATFTPRIKTSEPSLLDRRRAATLYYEGETAFGGSVSKCGSVRLTYLVPEQSPMAASGELTPYNFTAEANIARELMNYSNSATDAVANSILNGLQQESESLLNTLLPASGTRGLNDTRASAIEASVKRITERATQAGTDAMQPALERIQELTKQSLEKVTGNGWMYAVLYQRTLASSAAGLGTLTISGLSFTLSEPDSDLSKVMGCAGIIWSNCTAELQVFFDQYGRDLNALKEYKGAFTAVADAAAPQGANGSTDPDMLAQTNIVIRALSKAMSWLSGASQTLGDGWIDPIPQIQATGGQIMIAGGIVGGAGSIGSAVGGWGELLGMVKPLGWLLLTIGFVMAVMIPYMPLIYFFLAAFSWLVLTMQSIISAPLVLMQMFYPNRQGGIGGTSLAQMLHILLALLLRPALIIIGLIFCTAAMRVGIVLWNVFMANSVAALTAATGGFSGMASSIAIAIGSFFIYASGAFLIVHTCCSLIDGVSEFVMDKVESGLGRLATSEASQRTEGALGNPGAILAAATIARIPHGQGLAGTKLAQTAQKYLGKKEGK